MKIVFVLMLLLDVCPSEGQQMLTTEMNGEIQLSLVFPSSFNSYAKWCCKIYYGECYIALNNRGYVCQSLTRRVTIQEFNGRIDFTIQSAQQVDAGPYRCSVLGASYPIYKDFYLEILETSRSRQSLPPIERTAEPVLSKDHTDNSSVSSSLGGSLIAVLCIVTLIIISATVITLVHRKVKAKNKCGGASADSSDHMADQCAPQDLNSVVYTTVDFKPHDEDPSALYANLDIHGPGARGRDSAWSREHDGTVVYSTLAISQ